MISQPTSILLNDGNINKVPCHLKMVASINVLHVKQLKFRCRWVARKISSYVGYGSMPASILSHL